MLFPPKFYTEGIVEEVAEKFAETMWIHMFTLKH